MTREAILKEAMLLSSNDRAQLIDELWASMSDAEAMELTPAQRADLRMRLEEHRAGKSNPQPWELVREQLLKGK